jgi:hypothetical protein
VRDLKLEELLRYGFSGGLLLLVLLYMHPSWRDGLAKASGVGWTAILIGVALLAGSLIYALHRALAYRVAFTVTVIILICSRVYDWESRIIRPFIPSELELGMDRRRLALRQRQDVLDQFTAEWGAQVHFLYCAAWAILLGMVLGPLFPNCQRIISHRTYFVASAVLVFGAFWHHARLLWWIKANEGQNFAESAQRRDS